MYQGIDMKQIFDTKVTYLGKIYGVVVLLKKVVLL